MTEESRADIRRKIDRIAADQGMKARDDETDEQLRERIRANLEGFQPCTQIGLLARIESGLQINAILAENQKAEVIVFYTLSRRAKEPTGEDWEVFRREYCPAGLLLTPVNALTMWGHLRGALEREKAYLSELKRARFTIIGLSFINAAVIAVLVLGAVL